MDVQRIVRTSITTGDLTPTPELVDGINTGKVPILDIVKALGEYLTTTEDDVRLKGLTFLTNLVKVISPQKINRQATQTLTRFYLSKLDEFDCLPLALQALTVFSKLPVFDDDAAVEVYKAIVENVNMKAHVQAIRHMVYTLFDSLLATHRQALKNMGSEFINSYTKMLDGEKDPRNLMLLFSMDKVILLEFDVKEYIEDFFDITFCYFPIAFKPPPNDPYGITADDLKLALRGCMSASPYFAKMAIPLFLEKFGTATGQAMKDLMLSMAACFPVYGAQAVSERGTELWEGIKTEIMYSSDTTIEAAALTALESLMRTLYPKFGDAPVGLAQDVIKQSLEILQEPEKTQGVSMTKAFAALIRASPSTGAFTLSQALPQLFRLFNRPALPSHRAPILTSISSLLIACRSVYGMNDATRRQEEEKSLEPYREGLLDVLREGLRTDNLKDPAVRGSVALIEIPGFLGKEEVEELVRGLNEIVVKDNDTEIRSSAVSGLTTICKPFPSIIETTTLPLLFHNLPDQAPAVDAITDREKYRSILASLSELCVQVALFETLVIRITTKLDLLASQAMDSDDNMDGTEDSDTERECLVVYAWDLLNCLSSVIDAKLSAKHVDVVRYFDKIIPTLYQLVIGAASTSPGSKMPLFRDRRLLAIVGKISEKLMWELNAERQAKQFAAVYVAFEKGDVAGVIRDVNDVKGFSGSPLRSNASSPEQDLIAIYSSSVQGLKAGVSMPYANVGDYLSSKIHWTIHVARDQYHVRWSLDLITAIVNKRADELKESIDGIMEAVWIRDVIDTEQELETRRRGILVYLHIIKALALLRLPLAYSAVERVTAILKLASFDPELVHEAAKGFSVLGKGKEKESHLTAKLLYAQKLWNHILPRLIEGDAEATGRDRLVYLVAFSSLLPLVPASLCLADLPTILPLLLRSLSLSDPNQRINAIKTLISVLETANMTTQVDQLLHKSSSQIVESLLKSALNDPSNGLTTSGVVRSTALRCLAVIPDVIRYDSLQGIKAGVIKDLWKGLDDPLRAVRKEAVECRAKWYRYGTSS